MGCMWGDSNRVPDLILAAIELVVPLGATVCC